MITKTKKLRTKKTPAILPPVNMNSALNWHKGIPDHDGVYWIHTDAKIDAYFLRTVDGNRFLCHVPTGKVHKVTESLRKLELKHAGPIMPPPPHERSES